MLGEKTSHDPCCWPNALLTMILVGRSFVRPHAEARGQLARDSARTTALDIDQHPLRLPARHQRARRGQDQFVAPNRGDAIESLHPCPDVDTIALAQRLEVF